MKYDYEWCVCVGFMCGLVEVDEVVVGCVLVFMLICNVWKVL